MAPRSGKPRDPARERSWRRTMAAQARSGLSIAAFCRRQGLKPWTFRRWRQELARRVVRGPSPGPPQDRFLSGDGLEQLLDDDQAEGYAPTPVGPVGCRLSDGHVQLIQSAYKIRLPLAERPA
jgi:hypothetical protein